MDWKNLGQRVAVGVIFIPLILAAIWRGELWFLSLLEIIIVAGLFEFFALAQRKNLRPHRVLGVFGGAAIAPLIYFGMSSQLWLFFTALAIALIVVELFAKPVPSGSPLLNVSATFFGVAYVAGMLSFLLLIREMPRMTGGDYSHAGAWVIMIFVTIWMCDTAAYFCGLYFGKHKLFERVSPKKTIEGALGGFIFAIIVAVICRQIFAKGLRLQEALIIGLIIGIVGQISDLVESLFKRDAGVKDSSTLIPGHGGMLDRFDSEMLVAPIVYFYLMAAGVS